MKKNAQLKYVAKILTVLLLLTTNTIPVFAIADGEKDQMAEETLDSFIEELEIIEESDEISEEEWESSEDSSTPEEKLENTEDPEAVEEELSAQPDLSEELNESEPEDQEESQVVSECEIEDPEEFFQKKETQTKNHSIASTPAQEKIDSSTVKIENSGMAIPSTLEVSNSNLNDYELPLLSSFKDRRSAAIIVESLQWFQGNDQQLFAKNDLFFVRDVYEKIFGHTFDSHEKIQQTGKEVPIEEAVPGDIIFWKQHDSYRLGIYLGNNQLISANESMGVKIHDFSLEDTKTDRLSTIILDETSFSVFHFLSDLKLTTYGEEQIKNYPVTFEFKKNIGTQQFIDSIAESARELSLEHDLFASVMIAQAVLESGSGSSSLSQGPYFNLFGIKGAYEGTSVRLKTQEDNGQGQIYGIDSTFRVYPSYKESLEDYVRLLRQGIIGNKNFYQKTWRSEAGNYLKATAELTGRYATDTFYNNKLNSIIATYHLTTFDRVEGEIVLPAQELESVPLVYREKIRYPKYNGVDYNLSGSYESDQCTWYVFNRVHQLNGTVDDFMGNGADWGSTGKRLGYTVSGIPKVGTVISFQPGILGYHPLYGHVAFVEAVGTDGILISEGNVAYVLYKVIPNQIALSNSVSYIEPK
ncbi:glucosaminidase domain-containing protein [Enterococcus olivae]